MQFEPIALPESERQALDDLDAMIQSGSRTLVRATGDRMDLPVTVIDALRLIVCALHRYEAVVVVPESPFVTERRAAQLLGLNPQTVRQLIDSGQLLRRHAGARGRLHLGEVVAYRQHRDIARRAALDQISKDAYESGLYDRTETPEDGENA